MVLPQALPGLSLLAMPDYQTILEKIHEKVLSERPDGRVASYIPGLAQVSPKKFGIHLHTAEGGDYSVGDSGESFSIQSITKVLLLSMVMSTQGRRIWKRVGVEASGTLSTPWFSWSMKGASRAIRSSTPARSWSAITCSASTMTRSPIS